MIAADRASQRSPWELLQRVNRPWKSNKPAPPENDLTDDERKALASSVHGFCREMARKHSAGHGSFRWQNEDEYYCAALLGAVIASRRYQPGGGKKFITYASWYILQQIQKIKRQEGRGSDSRQVLQIGLPAPARKDDAVDRNQDVYFKPGRSVRWSPEDWTWLLARLSKRSRHVVQRKLLDGWDSAEIGAELGLAVRTVNGIYRDALEALRGRVVELDPVAA